MTKEELRKHLEQQLHRHTVIYGQPVYTYAESVDQEKRHKKRMRDSQGLVIPEDQRKAEWDKYIDSLL